MSTISGIPVGTRISYKDKYDDIVTYGTVCSDEEVIKHHGSDQLTENLIWAHWDDDPPGYEPLHVNKNDPSIEIVILDNPISDYDPIQNGDTDDDV